MSFVVKKKIILFLIIPLVLSVLFYQHAAALFLKFLDAPAPELKTFASYCFSLLLDNLDLNIFALRFPEEYADTFNNLYPDLGGFCRPGRLFRHTIEALRAPAVRRVYTFFPYYFALCCVSFAALTLYKIAAVPEEEKAKNQKFLRGVKRVTAAEFCKQSKAKVKDPIAVLPTEAGNIYLSDVMLRQHSLILGSTGTGKSQLLISLIKSFIKNSAARLIFVDRKGEFYSIFGTPKDVLIHPFDQRGTRWNVFNEIQIELERGQLVRPPQDVKAIAQLLFQPERHKQNQDWYESAAAVFISACCYCILNGKTSNKELCLFLQSGVKNIMSALSSLPEECRGGLGVLGDDPKSKTANSIVSICNTVAIQLSHFNQAGPFSVRDWVHDSTEKSNLYISTAGRNDNTFTSVVTLLLDLAGREIKELPDDGNQKTKLVFIIDELGALPAMDTLKFLLTQARSKGVAVVLANQTFSKIKAVYSEAEARDLLANTKSRYFFSVPEAADADYISKLLGTAEVERIVESQNSSHSSVFGRMDGREGTNYNKQITQDATFLPGTIESLGIGQAIVQQAALPGIVSLVKFKKLSDQPKINAEYQPIHHEQQAATAYAAGRELERAADSEAEEIQPEQQEQDLSAVEEQKEDTTTKKVSMEKQPVPAVPETESDSSPAKEPPPAVEQEESHQRAAAETETPENEDEFDY